MHSFLIVRDGRLQKLDALTLDEHVLLVLDK